MAPTTTSRLRGPVASGSGENSEIVTVAAMSPRALASRATRSEAIEWPSSATRPSTSGSDRA